MATPNPQNESSVRHLYTTLTPPAIAQQQQQYIPQQDTTQVPQQHVLQPSIPHSFTPLPQSGIPQQSFIHQQANAPQTMNIPVPQHYPQPEPNVPPQQQMIQQSNQDQFPANQQSLPTSPDVQPNSFPGTPLPAVPSNPTTVQSQSQLQTSPIKGVTTTPGDTTSVGLPVYNFKFFDPGNNQITSDNTTSPMFITQMTRGYMDMPKKTVVTCTLQGEKAGTIVQGEIDWKNKKVIVGNVSKGFKETKHKIGGTLSLDLEWTWPSGKYKTTHKSNVYVATRSGQKLATYTKLRVHAFSKNELATLIFHLEMPYEEMVFLIIALLFHDLQLPPVAEPRTFKQAAGDAGVELAATVATNVATNALTSCCVVQ